MDALPDRKPSRVNLPLPVDNIPHDLLVYCHTVNGISKPGCEPFTLDGRSAHGTGGRFLNPLQQMMRTNAMSTC